MTDLTTHHLKHLLEQATPGPWETEGKYSDAITSDSGLVMWNADQAVEWCDKEESVKLAALTPEITEKLIRLRDGVEQILEMCLRERDAAFQDTPMRAGEVTAFNLCAEQLSDLLEGEEK